jgi:SAM-dependent methyltransferase
MAAVQQGSASLKQPDYWWYRARGDLLEAVLRPFLGEPVRVLDVGSADGPSVGWMRGAGRRVAVDLLPGGLTAGEGVCASATQLPFGDSMFDVVAAFDVIEHCESESAAVSELARVLAPGGRMLLAVPAYQWAWTDHDVQAGHYRRYTEARLVRAVADAGLVVERSTHAFAGVFPFFVAERLRRRLRERSGRAPAPRLTAVSPAVERVLLGLSGLERRWLRRRDLPFGSSVFLAARKGPA